MTDVRTGFLAGFVSMSLLRLASAALSFALVVYVARQLGPAALGTYSLVTSMFVLLQYVPILGLHVALTRDVAGAPDRAAHQMVNGLLLAVPVSFVIAAVVGLAGHAMSWDQPEATRWIWIMAAALVPTAVTTVVEAVLIGREQTAPVAAVGMVENVGRTVVSLAAMYAGFGLEALFVLFSVGRVLAAATYLRMPGVRRLIGREHVHAGTLRKMRAQVPTFFAIMLLAQLMERLGFLLLAPLAGVREVGVYAASYKLYELMLMAPRILSMLLLPRFSACLAQRPQWFRNSFQAALKAGLIAGTPLVLLAAFFGDDIMRLYGHGYEGSAVLFRLLCFALLGVALNNLLSIVLVVTGNQRFDLTALVVAVACYGALLVALVPQWGALGAAVSTLVVAIIQPLVAATLLRKRVELRRLAATLARVACTGGAMWATLHVPLALPVAVKVGAAILAYVGTTLASRAWAGADLKALRAGLGGLEAAKA